MVQFWPPSCSDCYKLVKSSGVHVLAGILDQFSGYPKSGFRMVHFSQNRAFRPFKIQTKCPDFEWSLVQTILEKCYKKNILFITKRSRLVIKISGPDFEWLKTRWPPYHLKSGPICSDFKWSTSLDHFLIEGHKKYFIHHKTVQASDKNIRSGFQMALPFQNWTKCPVFECWWVDPE